MTMTVSLPELSLVVLVGVSGSGKSTFAARHFLGTEVISSDFCRGLVSDDENDQSATQAAFERWTLGDAVSEAAAIAWWEELTAGGGEGMVVKPVEVIHRGPKGLAQPGIKCRGREYLRIIYGPEYTAEANLTRLRSRGLGHKRSLALREFALGIEALERFVAGEPLYRVHECVFAVLALESEPVDPRL